MGQVCVRLPSSCTREKCEGKQLHLIQTEKSARTELRSAHHDCNIRERASVIDLGGCKGPLHTSVADFEPVLDLTVLFEAFDSRDSLVAHDAERFRTNVLPDLRL